MTLVLLQEEKDMKKLITVMLGVTLLNLSGITGTVKASEITDDKIMLSDGERMLIKQFVEQRNSDKRKEIIVQVTDEKAREELEQIERKCGDNGNMRFTEVAFSDVLPSIEEMGLVFSDVLGVPTETSSEALPSAKERPLPQRRYRTENSEFGKTDGVSSFKIDKKRKKI